MDGRHSFQWSRMTRDGHGIRAYQTVTHGITLRPIDCMELYPQEELIAYCLPRNSWKSKTLIPGKARHLFLEKPDTNNCNCLVFPGSP